MSAVQKELERIEDPVLIRNELYELCINGKPIMGHRLQYYQLLCECLLERGVTAL